MKNQVAEDGIGRVLLGRIGMILYTGVYKASCPGGRRQTRRVGRVAKRTMY